MASSVWGAETAAVYDQTLGPLGEAAAIEPVVDVLAGLAGDGAALELAVGTGRVALPLARRGVPVHGIDLSPAMVERLRAKPGSDAVQVTVGDMTSTRVAGSFAVVYLLYNTIGNVTTQEEQVAVFCNAAAHLRPGGAFVVEVLVPRPRRSPQVFAMSQGHVGIDTFDDPVGQIVSSHHWTDVDGRLVHESDAFRYVWPSELDLMARLAGMELRHRWAGWDGAAFTADSPSHVSIWVK